MSPRQLRRVCTMRSIAGLDNLRAAADLARRGKRRRRDVEAFELRREVELARLRDALLSGAWRPGPYRFFTIFEPKRRLIAAAPYRDRVVHHALHRQLAPVLERSFLARSFSCQVGKGTTLARNTCRALVHRHSHVLKCDVAKFFPSIDHALLRARLADRVACPGVLALCDLILASHRTGDEVPPALFPGDDWLEAAARPRGLPIGNLTSQLWGNFYLDGLDHLLADQLGHGDYLRYTDDFLLFGSDPARLWQLRAVVVAHLATLRLKFAEPKSRLLATREGVPFCGFRFFPGLRPRVLGETKRRFEARRRAWAADAADPATIVAGTRAWYAFAAEGNSAGLRRAYSRPQK